MLKDTALTWSWLNILTKRRYDALVQAFGDMDETINRIDRELLKNLGCKNETVEMTIKRLEKFSPSSYFKRLGELGIGFVSIEDPSYPKSLLEIPDPPVFLYFKGSLDILKEPCIGCVGTREMSAYGKRAVQEFIPSFVRAGAVTVSGLALGIDAQVARETIDAGGKTAAVLGNGLSSVYPRSNSKLADEIIGSGGLILSEFPLDQKPDKYTFPSRNRIIAGLSLGTIVLEAGEGSGALITADLALDYGREVFAVPGQIFDENFTGCNREIAKGHAKLVLSADDVLCEIGIIPASGENIAAYEPKNDIEKSLYMILTSMPQSLDEISEKSNLKAGEINSALTVLELSGAAKNLGGGLWIRG